MDSVDRHNKYVALSREENASTVTPTQSSWSGTPSADGREVLSAPRVRWIGAGVTGRLGRSISVGKSVTFEDDLSLGLECVEPGETAGLRRACCRSMKRWISGSSSQAFERS